MLRVANSLPVWCEAEAGVICPPALCARRTGLSPSIGPLTLRDLETSLQNILATAMSAAEPRAWHRGSKGLRLPGAGAAQPLLGGFREPGPSMHRDAVSSKAVHPGSRAGRWYRDTRQGGEGVGGPQQLEEECFGMGWCVPHPSPAPIPLPSLGTAPAVGGGARSPLFLLIPQCWRWLSSLLRPQAR